MLSIFLHAMIVLIEKQVPSGVNTHKQSQDQVTVKENLFLVAVKLCKKTESVTRK